MDPNKLVAEGKLEVGPKEEFFIFLNGDHLGKLFVDHFIWPENPATAIWDACVSPWSG